MQSMDFVYLLTGLGAVHSVGKQASKKAPKYLSVQRMHIFEQNP